MSIWTRIFGATLALTTVVAAGVAVSEPAASAAGSPLVFGVIGDNTGGDSLPQTGQAFQAYVDNWNAHGGYKGHPIKIINLDGATNPTTTANAARTLVTADNVIGIPLDYAFLDCTLDSSFYQSAGIGVVGGGTGGCYTKGTDFPIQKLNGSTGISVLVKFALNKGLKKIASLAPSAPGLPATIAYSDPLVKSVKGASLTQFSIPLSTTAADLDGVYATMKSDGIQAVIGLQEPPAEELMLQEANRESFGPNNGIMWLFTPNLDTNPIPPGITGSYVLTLNYPLSDLSVPAVKTAHKILKGKVSVLDGFAASGYQAGYLLQDVLSKIKGPVTRASYKEALAHTTSAPLVLTPGLTVDLANAQKDLVGGFVLKAGTNGFTQAGPFIKDRY